MPAFTELIVGAFRAVYREGVHDLIVVATISVTVDVSSPQPNVHELGLLSVV